MTHWRRIFGWNATAQPDAPEAAAIGLGMGLPVLVAEAAGAAPPGLAAAMGAMQAGNAQGEGGGRALAREMAALALGTLAALAIARHGGWSMVAMVLLAGLAALAGGYSRPMAMATGRFIVVLVLVLSLAERSAAPGALLLPLAAGAALATVLLQGLRWLRPPPPTAPAPPGPGHDRLWRRWRAQLRGMAGWHYALRLTPGLAVAGLLYGLWPSHHLMWIALTVAILTERQPEPWPVKAVQRALGALLGVALAGLLMANGLPAWALALALGLLGGVAAWLRPRSYLALGTVMTPMVMLLLDGGGALPPGVLADRLMATCAGAVLVVAANLLVPRPSA
jgi:hypothetical protein